MDTVEIQKEILKLTEVIKIVDVLELQKEKNLTRYYDIIRVSCFKILKELQDTNMTDYERNTYINGLNEFFKLATEKTVKQNGFN